MGRTDDRTAEATDEQLTYEQLRLAAGFEPKHRPSPDVDD